MCVSERSNGIPTACSTDSLPFTQSTHRFLMIPSGWSGVRCRSRPIFSDSATGTLFFGWPVCTRASSALASATAPIMRTAPMRGAVRAWLRGCTRGRTNPAATELALRRARPVAVDTQQTSNIGAMAFIWLRRRRRPGTALHGYADGVWRQHGKKWQPVWGCQGRNAVKSVPIESEAALERPAAGAEVLRCVQEC